MGGHVATQLAQQEPARVERGAVIDTQGGAGLRDMPMLAALNCAPIVGAFSDRLRPIDAITEGALQTAFAADYPVPAPAHRSLERLTHRGVCRSTSWHSSLVEKPDALIAVVAPFVARAGG